MHVVSRSQDRPPWTTISVSGDLDVVGAPDLRREVISAVADGHVCLVLDLSAVDFIDSFGIGVVIGAVKRVRQRNGDLALVCPEPRVRRVFELCDIDRILPLHQSIDQVPDPTAAFAMMHSDAAGDDDQIHEIVLEIPARTEFVSFVRVVVATSAEMEPHMDSDRIDDLRVAVSEATTNAIESHVTHDSTDRIRVRCNLADDQVAVVIHDEGIGFEPEDLPELPSPESPERLLHEAGLGVPLMKMLADESEIISTEGGTDVRLVVYSSRRRRGS